MRVAVEGGKVGGTVVSVGEIAVAGTVAVGGKDVWVGRGVKACMVAATIVATESGELAGTREPKQAAVNTNTDEIANAIFTSLLIIFSLNRQKVYSFPLGLSFAR